MTTFYLVRHGSNDLLPHTLAGRRAGLSLNAAGRAEVAAVAERLAGERIQHVFSSPLERCRETAEPIAARLGLAVRTADELLEVDFGDWTGKTFAELEFEAEWKRWNSFRTGARIPNGETMLEVQSRVVAFAQHLHEGLREQRVALVSHGDPLRALLLHFLGMPLEHIRRIELDPASISTLELSDWEARVTVLNWRPALDVS